MGWLWVSPILMACCGLLVFYAQKDQIASVEISVELEVENLGRMRHLGIKAAQARTARGSGGLWMWGSLALLMLSFGLQMDGPTALRWVGAIAFHEAGHYGAMRLLGYENVAVFFLPFLGAMTTGQKPQASRWEEVFVLLAGPLPGIGLALLLKTNGWLADEATILLGFNLLNLLPIYPLDGGQAVLVMLQSLWAEWVLKLGAIASLLFLGQFSVVFLLLAIVVAWDFPQRTAG